MNEVIFLVVKIIAIVLVAMFLGYKTGLFSLGRVPSVITLLILCALFSFEIYESLVLNNISMRLVFSSSFASFNLDLSFFIRIFLATLLAGLICSVAGVKPSAKIYAAKDICILAVLIAITTLLAVYGTIRVGVGIKISFKFIPVFITASLFGPLWGGAVGAIADVISFVINPVGGMFLPQITMVEFLYGFTYGLFFFNMGSWQGFKTMVKLIVCIILQIVVLNMLLTTHFLVPIMNMEFENLLVMRSVSAVLNMAIQLVALSFMSKYIALFRKTLK